MVMMEKYKEVFKVDLNELPLEREVNHTIETNESEPISLLPYRMTPLETDELNCVINDLLMKGFISPSKSPWAAPILFVKKKNGSLRMCVDYRRLNAITIRNMYPLPRIDDLLDRLAGSRDYSKIDLCSGYYQILVDEKSVEKTALRTQFGHFEFKVMPIGLTNAPPTFMRLMNNVFGSCINNVVLIIFDDIQIFDKNKQKHS